MTMIRKAYEAKLAAGSLLPDAAQLPAVGALDDLLLRLAAPAPARGLKARLLRQNQTRTVQGLYLYGPVGRGKSMLMDLFFEAAPVAQKRRVHFHAFMQEIHAALFAWRQQVDHGADPLPQIAQDVVRRTRLLCFDEFYVQDIADAMLLARLFEALFAAGLVLVATSNCAPDVLYANGLQRANFLPFIALLKQNVAVVEVAGAIDHRLAFLQGQPVYFTPLNAESSEATAKLFAALTNGAIAEPCILLVQGREVSFSGVAQGVLRTNFAELCQRALGVADYLAVARRFHTVILEGVPQFRSDQRNETMRFITLVDALYEAKAKLVMTAQVTQEELYPSGLHALMFHRTASRLAEMQ
ncbi:MAG: AFG1 family ATPase, partial [Alphaproteobacteria bacterium]|nr:AFG1 family ATPase [Alphaproteobacteria bacterium]